MAGTARPRMTEAEYLDFEEKAERKHHFIDGEVIAIAGASSRHNAIAGNVKGMLWQALRLDDPEVELPLSEIYRDVQAEPSDAEHDPLALG